MRIQFSDLQDQLRFGHGRRLPRTIGIRQKGANFASLRRLADARRIR
jgi:hypothetical protein